MIKLHASMSFDNEGPTDVTVLAYFYRPPEIAAENFRYLECAILETWRWCGRMKTVVVVNEMIPEVRAFRDRFDRSVSIQVEPLLEIGNLDSMSVDCNARLFRRFETPYVLVVQDDGFPICGGLERFLGRYDFVGAPLRRRVVPVRLLGLFRRHWPSNGGFSLRTRRICKLVSEYWTRYYQGRAFTGWQSEDMFFTDTIPREFPAYRWRVNIANARMASRFSYDGSIPQNLIEKPFGFHSARAFCELFRRGFIA